MTEQETVTLSRRIAQDGIIAIVKRGSTRTPPPDMGDMDAWTVTFKRAGRSLSVPFYMGLGHHGEPPTVEDVLDCMLSDTSGYEQARDFDDWAAEYGYDPDSRKAYAVWHSIAEQARKLRQFLGDLTDAYLYETERL